MAGLDWIDSSRPSMWVVTLPQKYTVEEFAAEFDVLTVRLRALSLREPTTMMVDVTNLRESNPRNRVRAARFFREEASELRKKVRAWGFVSPSAALRGAITAIGWLGAFPIPTQTFDKRSPCELWLLGCYRSTEASIR